MTHNLDIKGAIVERFQKSLKSRMYKFFIKNNIYRYLDVINKLVIGYNNSVHSTIGMPPSKVTPLLSVAKGEQPEGYNSSKSC